MMDRFIAEDEVGKLFSASDLIVQPYRSATQSGVTQIAYWFDVPTLVTDVGGLGEIVPDGETGLVVRPDAEAIAEAIGRFFSDGLLERFRTNIREYKKRFTWERMVENPRNALRTDRSGKERSEPLSHHSYLPPAGQTDSRKKRTPHKGVRVVLACRRHESALGSGGPKTPVPSRSERCLPGYLSDGNDLTPDPGKNGGGRLSETNRSRKP